MAILLNLKSTNYYINDRIQIRIYQEQTNSRREKKKDVVLNERNEFKHGKLNDDITDSKPMGEKEKGTAKPIQTWIGKFSLA